MVSVKVKGDLKLSRFFTSVRILCNRFMVAVSLIFGFCVGNSFGDGYTPLDPTNPILPGPGGINFPTITSCSDGTYNSSTSFLYPVCSKCTAGYYCTGGTRTECPTTVSGAKKCSNPGAKSASDCFANYSYKVNFMPNGGAGTMSAQTMYYCSGYPKTLTANAYTKTGYDFTGWCKNESSTTACTTVTHANQASITEKLVSSKTVTAVYMWAQWKAKEKTITLNANNTCQSYSGNLYTRYSKGVYLDSGRKTLMSTNSNPLNSKPTGKQYTLTFNANSGKWSDNTTTKTQPFNLVFKGFYSGSNQMIASTGKITTNGDTAGKGYTSDQTWTAQCDAYTINLSTIEKPTRTGYTFGGWCDTIQCDNTTYSSTGSISLTEGKTLYAKWTPITYTVQFNDNNPDVSTTTTKAQSITYGTSTKLTKNTFARTGYNFTNWCTTESCNTSDSNTYYNEQSVLNLTSSATTPVKLYSQWEPKEFTITLNKNGGVSDAEPGTLYTTYDTGVYLNSTRTDSDKMATDAHPITTKPVGPQRQITYDENAGIDDVTISGEYTTTFNKSFTGFTYTKDNQTKTTINANGYITTDGLDIGKHHEANATWTAQYGATTVTLPTNVTRIGYNFGGWCTTSTCTGDLYTDTASLNNNTTLHAKWTPKTYTIVFNKNNENATGTKANLTNVKYNETITLTDDGYGLSEHYLAGWCTVASCSGVDNKTYSIGESVSKLTTTDEDTVTLYAKWTTTEGCPSTRYFNYTANECRTCPTGSYCNGCADDSPSADCGIESCPTGYTSEAGASDISECYVASITTCAVANPYEPQHVENWEYSNIGNVACKKYCDWDESLSECSADAKCIPDDPDDCKIDTNTFECETGYNVNTTGDLPLCTLDTYQIIYHLKGGKLNNVSGYVFNSTNDTAIYDYSVESDAITLPTSTVFTKRGHDFGGWFEDDETTVGPVATFETDSATDTNFYAKWEPTVYQITYNTNGGTCTNCNTVAYNQYTINDSVTLPSQNDITQNGFSFGGWYDNNGFDGNPVTNIALNSTGNKAFFAKWNANTYAVKFKCDDELRQSQSVKYNDDFSVPYVANELCQRDGYSVNGDFVCTKDSDNGVISLTGGIWNIASGVTCNANTSPKTYTITYTCGGNTVGEPQPVTFASTYELADSVTLCTMIGFTPSTTWSCSYEDGTVMEIPQTDTPWVYPYDVVCDAQLTANTAKCVAGTYLPANATPTDTECQICEEDSYCPGYDYYSDEGFTPSDYDQGIESCTDGMRSPMGTKSFLDCGYIMHVGNDVMYLSQKKQTGSPSLAVQWGSNKAYASMSPVPSDTSLAKPITSGSNVKLHVKYKNVEYTVHDNTVE